MKSKPQDQLSLALAQQAAGQSAEASSNFLQVLKVQPGNVVALYSMLVIESSAGRYVAAMAYANRAVAANSGFAPTYLARSMLHVQLGNLAEALADADLALRLQPDLAGAASQRQSVLAAIDPSVPSPQQLDPVWQLNSQGIQAQQAGQVDAAAGFFRQALQLESSNFAALYSMGVITNQQGLFSEAMAYLSQAVASEPTNAKAHFALGTTLQSLALYEAALASLDKALNLNPLYVSACTNKATLLHSMNRQHDALLTLDTGLEASPGNEDLLNNKAYLLTEFKKYQVSAAIFKQLLDKNPDYPFAQGLHADASLNACDWTDFEANRQRIIEGIRAGKKVCNPLTFAALTDSAADQRRCAEIFGDQRYAAAPEPMWRGETYRHRKKRVAFLSADFREHPVGYLLIGLIEQLDKTQFETYGISVGVRDGSELYRRYRNGFDHYLDLADKTGAEGARILRAMEIDIAIDLSGYTVGTRLDILSHRPVPAQVAYLGYPGTLGSSFIDYLIADRITVPESAQAHYREKLLYLPHCYLPRDTSVTIAPSAPPRKAFDLPEDATVFCSFNHEYKVNPELFTVWMDLLRETPGSVLWMMKFNNDARQNLMQNAKALGVDPQRLVFASRVPKVEDHLARFRHADVFLDTFPYNGHTTASDALLAGVPVVTLTGNSFASRVATSLLHDAGHPEWACADLASYRACALEWAASRGQRKTVADVEWPISQQMQASAFGELLASI